jgi:hypothetical protein
MSWEGLAGSAWLLTMSLTTRAPGLLGSEGALMMPTWPPRMSAFSMTIGYKYMIMATPGRQEIDPGQGHAGEGRRGVDGLAQHAVQGPLLGQFQQEPGQPHQVLPGGMRQVVGGRLHAPHFTPAAPSLPT